MTPLEMAEIIHKARWPADRQMAITPFADEDRNGREYCFRIARAVLAAQPRLFTGCLHDGVCRGVCNTTDCPNYDLVVAARLVVEKQMEGIAYPDGE